MVCVLWLLGLSYEHKHAAQVNGKNNENVTQSQYNLGSFLIKPTAVYIWDGFHFCGARRILFGPNKVEWKRVIENGFFHFVL